MQVCFHYQFHPVGQGLFASGCLYKSKTPDPEFLWVYDCGSVTFTGAQWWDGQIQRLKQFAHYRPDLELLALSHFDDDHISGVTALLHRFNVNMLLVPYVPLWRRLMVAFGANHQGDTDVMNYFVDPVSFLRTRGQIDHVVLVPPSRGEGPPIASVPIETEKGPWAANADIKRLDPSDPLVIEFGTKDDLGLELLPSGGRITVRGLWEFCPYNKPLFRVPPQLALFRTSVDQLRDDLIHAGPNERQPALTALKRVFDQTFGASGAARNRISLYLYGGPIYPSWRASKLLTQHGDYLPPYPRRQPCYHRVHAHAPGVSGKCSVLYSGDGFLNSEVSFRHIHGYLGLERMTRLGAYQVNHHGARGNWHPNLARKLDPRVSVFSSDPARGPTNHPHPEVSQDYAQHQPVQVNRRGHGLSGWMIL